MTHTPHSTKDGICVNQQPRVETYAQSTARRAKEMYDALLAQGFTEDQAVDLTGAFIIGEDRG